MQVQSLVSWTVRTLAARASVSGHTLVCLMQAPRRLASNKAGMMGYEDFVWFILSEEDKSKDISLEYWFKCCDLDCDGRLTPTEMLVSMACACFAALLCAVVAYKQHVLGTLQRSKAHGRALHARSSLYSFLCKHLHRYAGEKGRLWARKPPTLGLA